MEPRANRSNTTHIEYDDSENGLVLVDKYIPEELLVEILRRVNYKTLVNCHLVCKQWHVLIQRYVWRKKAEDTVCRWLPFGENIPWTVYYSICKKQPFEKNLLLNHSGADGAQKHWKILYNGGDRWTTECPPVGVPPLPANEPIFKEKQICFATSYDNCAKVQIINLENVGLPPILMDTLQPPIMVSEWYSCRWDCPAQYECSVKLLKDDENVIDAFHFYENIEGDKQYTWLQVSHVFRNYGPGVKRIVFYHCGKDRSFWKGHYGSKMAGACVCVKLPEV